MIANQRIANLYLTFVFFPYVTIHDFGSDMQPWAMLIGTLYLIKYRFRMNSTEILLIILLMLSVSLIVIGEFNFQSVRSIFNYLNLFVCTYASYRVLAYEKIKFELFLKIAIIVWITIGLVQVVVDRSFMDFLLPSMRTTDNRGVTSLATEPTFFGIILIFLIIICTHIDFKNKNLFIGACVLAILFIAQSSMALLFLIIMIFYYSVSHISIKTLIVGLFVISSLYFIVQEYMENSRVMSLILLALNNKEKILYLDASLNDRFYHILFALNGFTDKYFQPHGYMEWNNYASKQIYMNNNFAIAESFTLTGRIMSGYGAALFEIGFFALIIPAILMKLLWSIYKKDFKKFIFYTLTINTIMFSSIPIGLTIFAFYIAFLKKLSVDKLRYD